MTVAHLGPPAGRQGGPAGYLAQLGAALAAGGSGPHRVLMPAGAAAGTPAPDPQPPRVSALTTLRRWRRTWFGAPRVYRPSDADLRRVGGAAGRQVEEVWSSMAAGAAAAIARVADERPDVYFAHDAPTAEAALDQRHGGQQVWLLLHNPMPLALYLAWCWGVPEVAWRQVAAYPDVSTGIDRERRVIEAVDRLIVPCREAGDELVRAAPSWRALLHDATCLLTGAAGPRRAWPALDVPALRARFGLPADRPVGVFIGNALPYRGLDLLLEAIDLLPADAPAGVVAVAGCPPDRLPLRARLRALGPVWAVSDLLAAADFVINVNRFSLFDLSTIEALEAGRPLLLAPVGGNLAVRALGAGTAMLPSLAPGAIADGLARMWGMATDTRRALGARSRQCYDAHLTLAHLRQRHLDLYTTATRTAAVGS